MSHLQWPWSNNNKIRIWEMGVNLEATTVASTLYQLFFIGRDFPPQGWLALDDHLGRSLKIMSAERLTDHSIYYYPLERLSPFHHSIWLLHVFYCYLVCSHLFIYSFFPLPPSPTECKHVEVETLSGFRCDPNMWDTLNRKSVRFLKVEWISSSLYIWGTRG